AAESSAHCGTVDASGECALGRAVEIFVEPFESTADLIEYKPLADATEPIAEPLGVDAGGLERVADIADQPRCPRRRDLRHRLRRGADLAPKLLLRSGELFRSADCAGGVALDFQNDRFSRNRHLLLPLVGDPRHDGVVLGLE